MKDYSQPDFYRFNEDSLYLVKEICLLPIRPRKILDIGAGSGIIGIELALKLGSPCVDFLELQKEWASFLRTNIETFLPRLKTEVFWSSVGEWKNEKKYDLIVSNPPYYLPANGRLSPDPVRARCRSFLEDDWSILLKKSGEALNPDGRAFFITARENKSHIMDLSQGTAKIFKEEAELVIIEVSSPECKSRS